MKEKLNAFFKDITDENLHDKVGEFISSVDKNYVSAFQTEVMFNLHNRIFPHIKETGKSCASCRGRVWRRLNGWYNENKKEG